MKRFSFALMLTIGLAACGKDVAPTGVVASGTLVMRAEVAGWSLPGTTFSVTGPTGIMTFTSGEDGNASVEGVVPGDYSVRVTSIDVDARLDSDVVQILVRSESSDTAVLTGSFDPGRFVDVAVGNAVICGLNENGNPYCWGLGEFGELGIGVPARSATPLRGHATEPLTQIVAGSLHMCALAESGAAYCWGLNASGRLGTGQSEEQAPFVSLPTPVAGGLRFSTLAAGVSFTCGLEAGSGRPWCWGSASQGQLGNGERSGSTNVPIPVDTDERFVALQVKDHWAGSRSIAARTEDGRVFVWGGSPSSGDSWLAYSGVTPVQVPLPGPASTATTVCAQLDTGVVCWPDLSGSVPMEVLDVLLPTPEIGLRQFTTEPLDPAFFEGGFHCRSAAGGYDCTDSWAFPLPRLDVGGETVVRVGSFGRGGCAVTEIGRVWCWSGDFFQANLAAGPGAGSG